MNKVGILTFHSANNFGALLQAVSLQKTIIERGNAECELINYEPEFICKDYSISPFKNKHPKGKTENETLIPEIEWNAVNSLLNNERKKSLDYIDRVLK